MTANPRTDVIAVASCAGTAVVAAIHDRATRAFDVHCSACGHFCTVTYTRGSTGTDLWNAGFTAADYAAKHAANCGVTP